MNIGGQNYHPGEVRPGYAHIGFAVEDEAETHRRLEALGATTMPAPEPGGHAYYEKKYRGIENLFFDVGHWVGARPLEQPAIAAAE